MEINREMLRVSDDDGKYTVVQHGDGSVEVLRYGEPWKRDVGNDLLAFGYDLEKAREENQKLRDAAAEAERKGWDGAYEVVKNVESVLGYTLGETAKLFQSTVLGLIKLNRPLA